MRYVDHDNSVEESVRSYSVYHGLLSGECLPIALGADGIAAEDAVHAGEGIAPGGARAPVQRPLVFSSSLRSHPTAHRASKTIRLLTLRF